jgi:paraquat-inducible protein B
MSDMPPEVKVSPARKMFLSGASVIWVIPLLALVVALAVAWRSYSARGPLIQVEFENGAGIAAGETELRYRDITVGRVESVGFTAGLDRVVVTIRVDKEVGAYIDSDAVFWVVQPQVTAQGITGLSTVLSGVYIEGSWNEQIGSYEDRFVGAVEPPLIRPGQSGLEIALRTTANGQLTDNAPILFKGIEVGRVGRAKIAPRGNYAIVEALIYEEHRNLVNGSTRFWDTSGFSFNLSPAGAEIDFSSLATLIGGGITFDTFVSGGERVQDGMVFEVFADKETARNSVFSASEVEPLQISAIFEDNISGLSVGAPVELSGFRIGVVETMAGVVDFDQFGDSQVRLNVNLSIQPARLGLPGEANVESALAFFQERVEAGMRARLASASLLTGGLKVELVMVEDAPEAQIVTEGKDFPVLPTTESEVSDAAATVEGVFNRINNLPIEELLNSAISLLNSAEAFVTDPNLRETPQDLRVLLGDLSDLVTSEDIRNIPVSLNATLTRVEGLVAQLEEQRLAERLVEAIDQVALTAESVTTSVEGVPALIDEVRAVATKAEQLRIEELISVVTDLVATANGVLGSEAATALPESLKTAVDEVGTALRELREGGALRDLNATLASARTAANDIAQTTSNLPDITQRLYDVLDRASEAAGSVTSSVEGVPELVQQIQAVAAKAESLEVEELLAELTALTRSVDAVVGTPEAVALPGSLKRALDEVNFTLQELREGGAVENVNQTLASARNAADRIAGTADNLPQIIARLTGLFDQASVTISGYDRGDELSRATQETLRDIQKAADALASLARAIERNPNSLLLGR